MRCLFWVDYENDFILHEFTLSKEEWKEYLKAHKLARWIPFTCPAFWLSPELESLVCGHTSDRYKRINEE